VDYRIVPVRPGEYPGGAGQTWAEPDIGCAAAWMARLAADPALGRRIGEAGQAYMRREHSLEAVGKAYAQGLTDLAHRP
jgi:glycosyltransferase involved in cell wall biosynthesis